MVNELMLNTELQVKLTSFGTSIGTNQTLLSKVKVSCDPYEEEERRQTKDRKIATPELFSSLLLHVQVPSQQVVPSHYRPTSETSFERRFAGGPIVAHR